VSLPVFGGVVQHRAHFVETSAEAMQSLESGLGRRHAARDEVLDA
jgi:hypothetical protein